MSTCDRCTTVYRVEAVMKRLQLRIPFLSDSERVMKRELENMDERLETYQRSIEQVHQTLQTLDFKF